MLTEEQKRILELTEELDTAYDALIKLQKEYRFVAGQYWISAVRYDHGNGLMVDYYKPLCEQHREWIRGMSEFDFDLLRDSAIEATEQPSETGADE